MGPAISLLPSRSTGFQKACSASAPRLAYSSGLGAVPDGLQTSGALCKVIGLSHVTPSRTVSGTPSLDGNGPNSNRNPLLPTGFASPSSNPPGVTAGVPTLVVSSGQRGISKFPMASSRQGTKKTPLARGV